MTARSNNCCTLRNLKDTAVVNQLNSKRFLPPSGNESSTVPPLLSTFPSLQKLSKFHNVVTRWFHMNKRMQASLRVVRHPTRIFTIWLRLTYFLYYFKWSKLSVKRSIEVFPDCFFTLNYEELREEILLASKTFK
jgi:hypothetical protein